MESKAYFGALLLNKHADARLRWEEKRLNKQVKVMYRDVWRQKEALMDDFVLINVRTPSPRKLVTPDLVNTSSTEANPHSLKASRRKDVKNGIRNTETANGIPNSANANRTPDTNAAERILNNNSAYNTDVKTSSISYTNAAERVPNKNSSDGVANSAARSQTQNTRTRTPATDAEKSLPHSASSERRVETAASKSTVTKQVSLLQDDSRTSKRPSQPTSATSQAAAVDNCHEEQQEVDSQRRISRSSKSAKTKSTISVPLRTSAEGEKTWESTGSDADESNSLNSSLNSSSLSSLFSESLDHSLWTTSPYNRHRHTWHCDKGRDITAASETVVSEAKDLNFARRHCEGSEDQVSATAAKCEAFRKLSEVSEAFKDPSPALQTPRRGRRSCPEKLEEEQSPKNHILVHQHVGNADHQQSQASSATSYEDEDNVRPKPPAKNTKRPARKTARKVTQQRSSTTAKTTARNQQEHYQSQKEISVTNDGVESNVEPHTSTPNTVTPTDSPRSGTKTKRTTQAKQLHQPKHQHPHQRRMTLDPKLVVPLTAKRYRCAAQATITPVIAVWGHQATLYPNAEARAGRVVSLDRRARGWIARSTSILAYVDRPREDYTSSATSSQPTRPQTADPAVSLAGLPSAPSAVTKQPFMTSLDNDVKLTRNDDLCEEVTVTSLTDLAENDDVNSASLHSSHQTDQQAEPVVGKNQSHQRASKVSLATQTPRTMKSRSKQIHPMPFRSHAAQSFSVDNDIDDDDVCLVPQTIYSDPNSEPQPNKLASRVKGKRRFTLSHKTRFGKSVQRDAFRNPFSW